MKYFIPYSFSFLLLLMVAYGQGIKPPLASAIKESEIRDDLFAISDDHFLGREAGTLDELKVSV